jgi:hypothetical protein
MILREGEGSGQNNDEKDDGRGGRKRMWNRNAWARNLQRVLKRLLVRLVALGRK